MKKFLTLIAGFLLIVSFISCTKKAIRQDDISGRYVEIAKMPDSLFFGSAFYGVWKIDSIRYLWPRPDAPTPYKGEGDVYMAFSNNGLVTVENKTNTPVVGEGLGMGVYDTAPWYGTTGQNNFKLNFFYPSSEWGVKEGLPYSGSFNFTKKGEQWYSHFSDKKMWFYKMVSGNNVVSIYATKSK